MLRCIITFGFLLIYITVSAPFSMLRDRFGGGMYSESGNKYSKDMICRLFSICTSLSGARLTYKGKEHIPADEAVLYVGNHKSYFDIILSYNGFADSTGYVAKTELFKATLGYWMRRISCIEIDREDPKSSIIMVKQSVEKIKNNISICIFPEGTRCRDRNRFLDFSDGSLKIAQRSGCKIIPMAIIGTYDLWEAQQPRIRPGKVIIRFGDPIDLKELDEADRKHPGAYVRSKIIAMYKEEYMEVFGTEYPG